MNNKYKMNNKSFYNKKIGKPMCCGINKFSKVSFLNVKGFNVDECSMNCDDSYYLLNSTVDPCSGNIIQNIYRGEFGSIDTNEGLYIITVWKNTGCCGLST